eukprot:6172480-Pleurochrysis_carterae.AAC.1
MRTDGSPRCFSLLPSLPPSLSFSVRSPPSSLSLFHHPCFLTNRCVCSPRSTSAFSRPPPLPLRLLPPAPPPRSPCSYRRSAGARKRRGRCVLATTTCSAASSSDGSTLSFSISDV